MSNCESCQSKGSCENKGACDKPKLKPKNGKIKNIIGVISGKGGVGKSTVTGILAIKLRKQGYKVGVLDGDITGPSMPRFFGISDQRAVMAPTLKGDEVNFIPVETPSGIKVISLNLLTQEEEQPVIWRGPIITGVLTQMYTDTEWDDLDYLLIDMPPGTGDIALTVMQNMPLNGLVVVSTPQDLVTMIVKKVVIMAEKLNIPIIGVVENMSYVKCEDCAKKIRVFSKKTGKEQAQNLGVRLLCEMPINLDLVESMENGLAESYILYNKEYDELLNNFLSYTE